MQIFHLQNYLQICRQTKDEVGEGLAMASLAKAYKEKKDPTAAIKCLEDNISLAERSNQLEAKAYACRDLGILCNQEANYEKAEKYFEEFLEIAKKIDDRRMMDKARYEIFVFIC